MAFRGMLEQLLLPRRLKIDSSPRRRWWDGSVCRNGIVTTAMRTRSPLTLGLRHTEPSAVPTVHPHSLRGGVGWRTMLNGTVKGIDMRHRLPTVANGASKALGYVPFKARVMHHVPAPHDLRRTLRAACVMPARRAQTLSRANVPSHTPYWEAALANRAM